MDVAEADLRDLQAGAVASQQRVGPLQHGRGDFPPRSHQQVVGQALCHFRAKPASLAARTSSSHLAAGAASSTPTTKIAASGSVTW